MTYLSDGINGNTSSVNSGEKLHAVFSPFGFAQIRSDLCPNLTESIFRADERAVNMREMYVGGSLRLLVAHELGHHVHHDTWSASTSKIDSRNREKRADDFAFRTLALSGTVPIEGLPLIILFTSVEGFSVESETESDHPAGLRRILDMYEATVKAIESDATFGAALIKNGQMEKWKQTVALLKQQLAQMDQNQ